jgi:DNA-binding CsgD family transcriptional regulator
LDLRAAADMAGTNASGQLLLTLADTELSVGNIERAELLCNRLLSTSTEPIVRSQVLTVLGRAALAAGRPDQFETRFKAAAEAAHDCPAVELAVLGEAVIATSTFSGPRSVLSWAEQARRILDDHPGVDRMAIDIGWAVAACMNGDPAGVGPVLNYLADGRLVAACADSPPVLAVWTAVAAHAIAMLTERFAESTQAFDSGWSRAQRAGSPQMIIFMGVSYADAQTRRGRLAEALELISSVEEAAADFEAGLSTVTSLPKAVLALETGDNSGAAAQCELLGGTLLRDFPDYYPVQRIWLWKVQAEMALDAGRTGEATALADAIRDLAHQAGVVEPCVVPWADTAMSAYVRAGRFDDVESLALHLETVSLGWPCRWPRSVAEMCWASLAEASKEYEKAEDHHRRAVALLDEVDLPLARVRALVNYGVFLRHRRRPAEARGPLGRAVELARACDATRLEAQALAELHASGGRRGKGRGSELSYQEGRTATLAAQGATNAEIAAAIGVSPRTVEHYLTAIYAKLGVRSRRQLPR